MILFGFHLNGKPKKGYHHTGPYLLKPAGLRVIGSKVGGSVEARRSFVTQKPVFVVSRESTMALSAALGSNPLQSFIS